MKNGIKIIDRFGDVDPINFGGGVLLLMPGGKYGSGYEMEYTHGFESEGISEYAQENGAKVTVYRLLVETKDDKFPQNNFDWVDWNEVLSNWPSNFKSLEEHFKSTDIADIAFIYHEIGNYHGFENLDQYPEKYSDSELRERWEL